MWDERSDKCRADLPFLPELQWLGFGFTGCRTAIPVAIYNKSVLDVGTFYNQGY